MENSGKCLLNNKKKTKEVKKYLRKEEGITLVALVVTIVVLLILAGVSIGVMTGENGIFNKATVAGKQTDIETFREKMEMIISDLWLDKLSDTVIDDFWNKLVSNNIIENKDEIEEPEKEGNNDVYVIYTKDDFIAEIIVNPDGMITIGDIEKGNKLLPRIRRIETTSTKTSFTAKAIVTRLENGVIEYYYKLSTQPDKEYVKIENVTEENKATVDENLIAESTYNIKVVVTSAKGKVEKETSITLKGKSSLSKLVGQPAKNINQTVEDDFNNKVVIPAGFSVVANGTGDVEYKYTGDGEPNVQDGVVIQDNDGNQYTWVPVGGINNKEGTTTITLGRYTFNASTGKENLVQNAQDYLSTEEKYIIDSKYQELATSNDGNSIAKNLEEFVTTTTENHGFYFGRYQAVIGTGETVEIKQATKSYFDTSQTAGRPWNYITKADSVEKCRNLYKSTFFESDLVNSYAWDTALVFIQTYSGQSNYSIQKAGDNSGYVCGSGGDKVNNIHDLRYGIRTYSTERTPNSAMSVLRGGVSDRGGNNPNTTAMDREENNITGWGIGFRPIIYVKK